MRLIEPAGAHHDFWQALVSGARGIIVYAHYHIRDRPELEAVWAALDSDASIVAGPERLGQVILEGVRQSGSTVTIVAGPDSTVSFPPSSTHTVTSDPNVRYPSIDLLTLRWRGDTYLMAVNSAEAPVSARISGLPRVATTAREILERTTIPLRNGTLDLDFQSLGVHVLKIPGR